MRKLFFLLVLALGCQAAPIALADGLVLAPPVPGAVQRGFEPGTSRYSAGHRGVDLAAPPGSPVSASAEGTVYFAGSVAGRPSVSIDHGNGWRTTYTPVRARVAEGAVVSTGQVIGVLQAGHCDEGCLHWGLTDGTDYLDPAGYLAVPRIRLLPGGAQPEPRTPLPAAVVPLAAGSQPVPGRITSPFGMRVHPVTGRYKLHDGLDIGASCGTPIRLPWAGRVVSAGYDGGYGYRVVVDHGDGHRSGYAHLPRVDVTVGQELASGQVVGVVGNTGYSTGCHLHWMVWKQGRLVDPAVTLR